ncbi:MAG: hypothetical protein MR916_04505 [Eubacterium sp.]|nr:hypothetical protein [Eubacterium sp.]
MNNQPSISPRKALENRYKGARYDIFIIFALTIVNLVLSFTDSNLYYLFSAEIPFFVLGIGRALLEKGLISSLTVPSVLSFVFCIPYLFFWIFSKKHYGCMIAALVYFSIDCVFLVSVFTKELALEAFIHLVVLGLLIYGVVLGAKLKKMPKDEPSAETPMAEGHSSEENQ